MVREALLSAVDTHAYILLLVGGLESVKTNYNYGRRTLQLRFRHWHDQRSAWECRSDREKKESEIKQREKDDKKRKKESKERKVGL